MPNPTPGGVVLLFIDIQPVIIDSSHTQLPRTLKKAAKAARKIAELLRIPVFTSVVPTGPKTPEPVSELEDLPVFMRQHAGSFDQPEIREAVAATGRKTLAVGGIVSEVAVLHGALTAIREGYQVHVLTDCCGGVSERTEHAAFRQIEQAGGTLSSVASFFTTIAGDFTKPEAPEMMGVLLALLAKEG